MSDENIKSSLTGEGLTGKTHMLVKFCGGHHTGPGAGKGWELPCPRRQTVQSLRAHVGSPVLLPQGRQPEGGRAIEHPLCARH